MEIPFGAMVFWKYIDTFQSGLQRFWTYTIYSHISLFLEPLKVGNFLEFEANTFVRFSSYKKRDLKKNDIIVFSDDVPEEVYVAAMKTIIKRFEGEIYGFFSWFTIFLRFLFQRIGFKDTHKWNILWGWGVHCSELIWYYCIEIIEMMIDLLAYPERWIEILSKFKEYNPDTFVPQDLIDIKNEFPSCLKILKIEEIQ